MPALRDAGIDKIICFVAWVGMDLCGALGACHQTSVIHGDVKPRHLMFNNNDDSWTCNLMGFECSHLSEGKPILGDFPHTRAYGAPELWMGGAYASRPERDLWGLGCVLYEMLEAPSTVEADVQHAVDMCASPTSACVPWESDIAVVARA